MFGNEDAIASDSDSDDEIAVPPQQQKRRKSSVVEPLTQKAVVEISRGLGALGKEAIWDDFPNGRFGDSNSPAYGEIDGYGPNLKIYDKSEAIAKWGSPELISDLSHIFTSYLSGKIDVIPWADVPLSPETALIQEELFELNEKGWFSVASQPSVNGCKSTDNIFGWGPPNGIVYQKSFVELFMPAKDWEQLRSNLDDSTTFYVGTKSGEIKLNLPIEQDYSKSKSAVTWGVFPQKEILQPTVIDYESFKAWNEEAFLLWLEWARCYKKNLKSFALLNSIYNDYVLVSLVHHDFPNEDALWRLLLQ